jgi:ATP-dependent Lhr-like helicase
LLARIHRATLNRLRREIEPVAAADFLRFLIRWQGLEPGERASGPASLERVIDMLEGFEASATAWEGDLLPARVGDYDPAWLDQLCLSGKFTWARLTAPPGRTSGPVRTTPIALVRRGAFRLWGDIPGRGPLDEEALGAPARTVLAHLRERGASFFGDLLAESGLLPAQVEEALAELVAAGRISADGFTGLRALLVPAARKARRQRLPFRIEDAGRWSLLPRRPTLTGDTAAADLEALAHALLRRYGVVFRKLLEREGPLPPWRDLLRIYHRLEARGTIRGGRFVEGFSGEQFALPEAVTTLREVRREKPRGGWISVSGADPLNLVGILTHDAKVPSLSGNRVLYRDGVPVAVQVGGEMQTLCELGQDVAWEAKKALSRRPAPAQLRVYLGR